jgi:hypothetical protein
LIRPGYGGSDYLQNGLLGGPDIHQDDAAGTIPTGEGQSTSYVMILDSDRRLLEGALLRPGNGGSDDLQNGLLNGPDIHQDDAAGAIPTREGPSMSYVMIQDSNRRLLEGALIRPGYGGSDHLQKGLLAGHDIHQDDSSGALPIEEGEGQLYALILEGNRRLLEGSSIRLNNGGFDAPPHGQKNDHNVKIFVPAELFSTLGANSKPLISPRKGDTETIREGPTRNDDGACGSLLSDEGEKCGNS